MDQRQKRSVPILPLPDSGSAVNETPASTTTQAPTVPTGGYFTTWEQDTGRELPPKQKRKPTHDEVQRTLRVREVGACADCRAAKRKVCCLCAER